MSTSQTNCRLCPFLPPALLYLCMLYYVERSAQCVAWQQIADVANTEAFTTETLYLAAQYEVKAPAQINSGTRLLNFISHIPPMLCPPRNDHAGVESVGRIREAARQPRARTRQKTRVNVFFFFFHPNVFPSRRVERTKRLT